MHDQADELRELMQRVDDERQSAPKRGPSILALGGGKGGVGTTTLAIGLSVAMARKGQGVLLIDADPQRADITSICGLEPRNGVVDVMSGRTRLEEIIIPGPEDFRIAPGLWTASTPEAVSTRGCERLIEQIGRLADGVRFVIVDTGSANGRVARHLRLAADRVLMVTSPEQVAVMDTYAAIKYLNATGTPPVVECIVNGALDSDEAIRVFDRLGIASRRFLGLALVRAGWTPKDETLRGTAAAFARGETFPAGTAWQRGAMRIAEGLALRVQSQKESNLRPPRHGQRRAGSLATRARQKAR